MRYFTYIALLFFVFSASQGQFSPGDLSEPHKQLEGIKNCTQCHSVGSKIQENKCLSCHKELNKQIQSKKGFHVSSQVKGKSCISCHSEHHGRKFDAIHMDEKKFDHKLTGFTLEEAHAKVSCRECHTAKNISNASLKKNKKTYLGLSTQCLSCHEDYHQKTLSSSCLECHSMKTFKTAPKFNHNTQSKFALKGAHVKVSCVDCHKITTKNDKKFQIFKGMPFSKCVDCHKDPHENKFGNNCTKCHNENSWKSIKSQDKFDHNQTGYPLEGKHVGVDCKKCHTEGYSKNLAYGKCYDCHKDYHEGEFKLSNGQIKDCKECHELSQNFTFSNYDLTQHQQSTYPLTGSHEATSCISCHKPNADKRWQFKFTDKTCVSCHKNIHEDYLDGRFYPKNSCEKCHNTNLWTEVTFDHKTTEFELEGQHNEVSCRECHFEKTKDVKGNWVQKFKLPNLECTQCHDDVHETQFIKEGRNDCKRCHSIEKNWPIPHFDHQKSEFPLEGKHKEVNCNECHKPIEKRLPDRIILYKIKPFECINCHGSK